jgi:predicted transposase
MRLTIQLKLQPTIEQANALKRTLETANAACDAISQVAWNARVFKQFGIHKLTYYEVKESFGLSAQLVVFLRV